VEKKKKQVVRAQKKEKIGKKKKGVSCGRKKGKKKPSPPYRKKKKKEEHLLKLRKGGYQGQLRGKKKGRGHNGRAGPGGDGGTDVRGEELNEPCSKREPAAFLPEKKNSLVRGG